MKTTIFILISLFISVNAVSAKTSTQTGNSDDTAQTQNSNQIQTQNAGQDKKLEVQNMEVIEEEGDIVERTTNHGQEVSQYVHELLQSRLASQSGIGQQVREVAQKQTQAQETIRAGLDKINSHSALFKKFFGTDKSAVKNLNQQIAQNQLRIEELTKIQTQVTNQADQDMLQTTLQSLIDQNTALSEAVRLEQGRKGFLSWITTLFNR
jgi:hypothetical protein